MEFSCCGTQPVIGATCCSSDAQSLWLKCFPHKLIALKRLACSAAFPRRKRKATKDATQQLLTPTMTLITREDTNASNATLVAQPFTAKNESQTLH